MQAGDELTGSVTMATGRLYVSLLSIELNGTAIIPRRWWFDDRKPIIHERRVLAGGRRFLGENSFDFRIALPPNLPPSHASGSIAVRYLLTARLRRPGFNGPIRAHAPLIVHDAVATSAGSPISSPRTGPLQLRAQTDLVRPGEVLAGEVVTGPLQTTINAICVCLEARMRTRPGQIPRSTQRVVAAVSRRFEITRHAEGHVYRFQLPVPIDAPITQSFDSFAVSWRLRAFASGFGARDRLETRVPIDVNERAWSTPVSPPRTAPPADGGLRIWERAARELGLALSGTTLRGRVEGADITLGEEVQRGDTILAGEVSYPSLGLGLRIEPLDGRKAAGDVSLGIRSLDRSHYTACREPAQVVVLQRLMPGVLRGLGTLEMNDERLRIERPHVLDELPEIGGLLVRFARTLPAIRAGVLPPAAMADQIDEWRELAGELQGSLRVADLSVQCEISGVAAEIRTIWEPAGRGRRARARPQHTCVSLLQAGLASDEVWLSGDELRNSERDLPMSEADRRALIADARALHITSGAITLHLPAPYPQPATLARRARLLRQLAGAMVQRGGPYR